MSGSDHDPAKGTGDHGTLGGLLSGTTFGVQNIEAAYSRAGAATNHTPGYASKLGSQEQPKALDGVGSGSKKSGDDGVAGQSGEVSPIRSTGATSVSPVCTAEWLVCVC